jgi:hypothetical protein
MRIASHTAAAFSAATARFNRPSDWLRIGARLAYWGSSTSAIDRASQGSRLKPE